MPNIAFPIHTTDCHNTNYVVRKDFIIVEGKTPRLLTTETELLQS
eukprot:gene4045-8437_t